MTQWGDAGRERDPVRFRRFRIFTNAVAVAICTGPEGPNDHMPPNYIGVRLLDDAHALQDSQLLRLLSPAFAELHQRIAGAGWLVQEAPFFLLGQLVLAFMGHAPSADVDRLCELLVAEEYLHLGPFTEDFLWGCTVFNQLHDRWKHFVELSFPIHSDNSSIVLLRDALLPPPTNIG